MIYTSSSLALAALEFFVHLRPSRAPGELVARSADIPASLAVTQIRTSHLGGDWRDEPAPERLAELGARWLREEKTPVLAVPSAVIPHETNYLLNPLHQGFRHIRIGPPQRFIFDPRMWKR